MGLLDRRFSNLSWADCEPCPKMNVRKKQEEGFTSTHEEFHMLFVRNFYFDVEFENKEMIGDKEGLINESRIRHRRFRDENL
jgi:hypothetical protein